MNDKSDKQSLPVGSLPAGSLLCRFVIPGWVLTGALFKLIDKSPRLLPKEIWQGAAYQGGDLYILLSVIVALEFTAAGAMFLSSRLARPVAIAILSVFCLVLINEMRVGNTSCGCLGSASPAPWVMLLVDGALLLGAIMFKPRMGKTSKLQPFGVTLVSGFIGAGLAMAVIMPEREKSAPVVDGSGVLVAVEPTDKTNGGEQDPLPEDPETSQDDPPHTDEPPIPEPPDENDPYGAHLKFEPKAPPAVFVPVWEEWLDKRFDEIDLAQYFPKWPEDIGRGRKYVIVYSRSCPHCQELFDFFFQPPPVPTLTVAFPETKEGWDEASHLPMNVAGCIDVELAVGTDWLITAPIIFALEDGVVRCVEAEVSAMDAKCLMWH